MFDYLAILLSIILGLALTHLLLGCSRMIQLRHSVKICWVQIVWTINVLVWVLGVWWGMFWWKHLDVWTIQEFFYLAAYSIVLFMLASNLFPMEFREGHDFTDYFYRNRRWFFGLLLATALFDIPETVAKSYTNLRGVPREYLVFMPSIIGIGIVGFLTGNRRVHVALSCAFLLTLLSYLTFTSLDRIVAT